MYDGCAQVVARQPGEPPSSETARIEAICEAHLAVELAAMDALTVMIAQGEPDRRTFCPPEGFSDAPDPTLQMARAYLAYFDSTPSVRESPDGVAVLGQALAEKWPCRR